jgi:hypothetical protein
LKFLLLPIASVAFVGQPLICQAENAGILSCYLDAEKKCGESQEPADDSSDEKAPGGCHQAGCYSPISASQSPFPALIVPNFHRHAYPVLVETLSDPPVLEIEYPPQLS